MSFSSPSQSSANLTGRMTGIALFAVVAACIALIGFSGYVKFELDRAELALTTPGSSLSPEQRSYDQIRNNLGFGGFLGVAQNFATSHDPALLSDMKAELKQADDAFERLPEKTPAEIRHDLQAILSTFETTGQKAEKAAASPTGADFSTLDLAPLYAALPVLDARVASTVAADRLAEQNHLQFWATLLTIICWSSLIIGSALAAGIYLVLRDRNSAPMRALAQSVKNMARGDMRTSIWGMERQDAIGELARSVDMARFHFSQLPDMSLLSEQGPVRIRFEGNTRSLFEAMMRVISRDSEQVHEQATVLTENVVKQQETLAHVIDRVEAVLQNVEKRAVNGDQQVRQTLQNILSSAESLKNAQEHAADQLNRIIPFLQERTQGVSEIAQIAGKQVASALQSLAATERGLRSSAEQSEAAIRKFSSSADTLGERMFGAVNLLQASGKVLAETTETMQSRLDKAVERINSVAIPVVSAPPAPDLDPQIGERFGAVIEALESSQVKLQQLLTEQAESAKAHIELLISQSNSLMTQTSTSSQILSVAADRMREHEEKMEFSQSKLLQLLAEQAESAKAHIDLLITQSSSLLAQTATSSHTLSTASDRLREEQEKMAGLLGTMTEMVKQAAVPSLPAETVVKPMLLDLQDGFASIKHSLAALQDQVATLAAKASEPAEPTETDEQMRDHWYQMAAQIEASRSNLAQFIAQQTDRLEMHFGNLASAPANAASPNGDFVREAQSQLEMQTGILSELVNTLSLLDAHMQDIRGQLSARQRAG